jgi:flavin reductase (DIM6/NTAB) family NADH-FMN oxidoreductase RutF
VIRSSDRSGSTSPPIPGGESGTDASGHSAVTPDAYRRTLAQFPTGVTIVAARDPQTGGVHGMTANGFMSVSLDPPLVVVSVRAAAHMHGLLTVAGSYGVSFLAEQHEAEARRFAGAPPADLESSPEFDSHSGVPVLRGAMAWLVAEVVVAHDVGDHTLFVGHVLDLSVVNPAQPPLCFFRARFARVTSNAGDVPVPLESWSNLDAWG